MTRSLRVPSVVGTRPNFMKVAPVARSLSGREETTFLGVPCFTLRDNTERPVTVAEGTNTLLGLDPARIAQIPELIAGREHLPAHPPEGWDGHAASRIVEVLVGWYRG